MIALIAMLLLAEAPVPKSVSKSGIAYVDPAPSELVDSIRARRKDGKLLNRSATPP